MAAPRLPPLPTMRDILKLYKLFARKGLSQNFLMNEKLTDKIIRKAGTINGSHVLEVGPGPGCLTRSIIKQLPEKLVVVEKDKRFKPTLDMLADACATTGSKMDIIFDDVLRINPEMIFPKNIKTDWADKNPNLFIIGNLPFSISTHLIIKWLKEISERTGPWSLGRARMTLTFQKEVAERLVAQPEGAQRCRLSIMAQAWTFPVLRFVIPGKAFVPSPKVDVGVVSFAPLMKPRTQHDFDTFEKVTRHIFSFRQKYSLAGVETLFPLHNRKELGSVMFKLSDIDPTTRPYQLTVEEIDRLVTAYKYLLEKHPELAFYEYRASRRLLMQNQTIQIQIEDL